MFCSNCGSKIDDDSTFCTSCGYHLQSKKTSSIDIDEVKSYFSIGLTLFKKPSSYVQYLKESINPTKNLIFLIGLLLLIPISILGFSSLNIFLFNRMSKYIFNSISISTVLVTIIFSVLLNVMLLSLCYYTIKLFVNIIFKYNIEMGFDDLVRVSTLPVLYLLISYISGMIFVKFSTTLSSIFVIIGFILFVITLFSGYKSLMPDLEIIPIIFTLGFSISVVLSFLIAMKFIENAVISTFRFI